MKAKFTANLRRVGGNNKRDVLGITVPSVVCEDLRLEKGDRIEVLVGKKQ